MWQIGYVLLNNICNESFKTSTSNTARYSGVLSKTHRRTNMYTDLLHWLVLTGSACVLRRSSSNDWQTWNLGSQRYLHIDVYFSGALFLKLFVSSPLFKNFPSSCVLQLAPAISASVLPTGINRYIVCQHVSDARRVRCQHSLPVLLLQTCRRGSGEMLTYVEPIQHGTKPYGKFGSLR